jgi:superfamily II DNA/RNA helicase
VAARVDIRGTSSTSTCHCEDYVHRIGRSARGEATGTAISIASDLDLPYLRRIEELIKEEIPLFALEGFAPSPLEAKLHRTPRKDDPVAARLPSPKPERSRRDEAPPAAPARPNRPPWLPVGAPPRRAPAHEEAEARGEPAARGGTGPRAPVREERPRREVRAPRIASPRAAECEETGRARGPGPESGRAQVRARRESPTARAARAMEPPR